MNISAISTVASQTQNLTHGNNAYNQTASKINSLGNTHCSDVLFMGNEKKEPVAACANIPKKNSIRSLQDVRAYVKIVQKTAPKIYNSIIEEENKATQQIKDTQEILDQGAKNNFQPILRMDGSRVEFKTEGQKIDINKYDKDNNLQMSVEANGMSIEKIMNYNPETLDVIEVENSKPATIMRGLKMGLMNAKNISTKDVLNFLIKGVTRIDAVYCFRELDEKSAMYNVATTIFGKATTEEHYAFDSKGKLKETTLSATEYNNGNTKAKLEVDFDPNPNSGKPRFSTARLNVKRDAEGNLKAGKTLDRSMDMDIITYKM